jgi:hypothetical protein
MSWAAGPGVGVGARGVAVWEVRGVGISRNVASFGRAVEVTVGVGSGVTTSSLGAAAGSKMWIDSTER